MYTHYLTSPIGILEISASDTGVTGIDFVAKKGTTRANTHTKQTAEQLQEYFSGTRKTFDLTLSPEGTPFQKRVWNALTTIPYGETKSYGAVAKQIGNKNASRAVGSANNKNPIPIVVPCHRVIGADGNLVGYGGGLDKKKKLLVVERS